MTDHTISAFGKRLTGTAKEIVAEFTGDARLQEDGRRDIAEGRTPSADERPDLRDTPRPVREGMKR